MHCKTPCKYKVALVLIVKNKKKIFFLIQNALEADFKALKYVDIFNSPLP